MMKEEPVITTFYFVLIVAMTFLMNLSMSDIDRARYNANVLSEQKGKITMMLHTSENTDENLSHEEAEQNDRADMIQKYNVLHQDNHIKKLGYVKEMTGRIESRFSYLRFYQYSQILFKELNYTLYKGHWPQKKNEMVLTREAMKWFHIGEKIRVVLSEDKTEEFCVSGFLVNNEIVVNNMYSTKNDQVEEYWYADLFKDAKQSIEFGEYTAVVSPDYDSKELTYMPTCFVKCRDDMNREESLQYLNQTYGNIADFQYFSTAYEEYKEEKLNIGNRSDIHLIIFMLLLFCTGFCINNVLRIQKKSREYAIYYMFGLTWEQSVLLSYIKNILVFLIAVPIGILLFYFNTQTQNYSELILKPSNTIFILVMMLLIYVIFSLPVYLHFRTMDPIDMQRKENIL